MTIMLMTMIYLRAFYFHFTQYENFEIKFLSEHTYEKKFQHFFPG